MFHFLPSKQTGTLLQMALAMLLLVTSLALAQDPPATQPTTAPEPKKVSTGPIRVGVLLSHFTATGPSWLGKPYGLDFAKLTFRQLSLDDSLELIPVIEPDTAQEEEIASALELYFKNAEPIVVTDIAALKKLEVLAVIAGTNLKPEVLNALEDTVKSGVGLLVGKGMGVVTPGCTAQVSRLHGLEKCEYGWNSKAVECVIKQEHPLLGKLKAGDTLNITPNGMYGFLKQGTSLIEVTDIQNDILVPRNKKIEDGMVFSPLYISQLGKGQIVGINWAVFQEVPKQLNDEAQGMFYSRCIKWLAGRPLDNPETN